MTAKAQLKAIETAMDQKAHALPVLHLPVRCLLTVTAAFLHRYTNPLPENSARNDAVAAGILSKLSYWLKLAVHYGSSELGNDAEDCFRGFSERDPQGEQWIFLNQYGRLSELMPWVHKDLLQAQKNGFGLTLKYRSDEAMQWEARDIALGEISSPLIIPPRDDHEEYLKLVDHLMTYSPGGRPAIVFLQFPQLIHRYCEHYFLTLNSWPLLTDKGFQAAFGCSQAEYRQFEAYWHTVAEICIRVASAMQIRAQTAPKDKQELLEREHLEWLSVNWTARFALSMCNAFTKIPNDVIDRLMRLFSINLEENPIRMEHVKDGFAPPFIYAKDSLIFSPHVIRSTLHGRNALFSLRSLEQNHFDNHVSGNMEDELVKIAKSIFATDPNLLIHTQVNWSTPHDASDLDLLVYSPAENHAVTFQAKAVLGAQGARLTRNGEDRMREGINQILRFAALPQVDIDKIISQILGQRVNHVGVTHSLLAPVYFGTERVWKEINQHNVAAVTPGLLLDIMPKDGQWDLTAFARTVNEAYISLDRDMDNQVHIQNLKWNEIDISVDLLIFDHSKLEDRLSKAWLRAHRELNYPDAFWI